MAERHFRIVLGLWLLISLYVESSESIAVLLVLLSFEAITNWRVPLLLGRSADEAQAIAPKYAFEAERLLRIILIVLIGIPVFSQLAWLWWLPWLIGFALLGAGLHGVCPMVLLLRSVGFR